MSKELSPVFRKLFVMGLFLFVFFTSKEGFLLKPLFVHLPQRLVDRFNATPSVVFSPTLVKFDPLEFWFLPPVV